MGNNRDKKNNGMNMIAEGFGGEGDFV